MKHDSEHQSERITQRRLREEKTCFRACQQSTQPRDFKGSDYCAPRGELSIVEWRVLWDRVEAGPMTIGDMAEIQRIDPSQLSRALPGMRKKGFVVMRQDNRDVRQVLVDIAPAGAAAYEKARPTMQRRRASLKAAFSDTEITQLLNLLDQFETLCREPTEQILEQELEND